MTDPMELVGRLDRIADGAFPYTASVAAEAAACIREMVAFVQSVADVPIDREDLNYTITNLRFGRGALAKETKTEAVIAAGTLRDILTAARSRLPLPPAPGAEA